MTIGGGTIPFNANYNAYAKAESLFICPSDRNTGRVVSENNYRCNFGGSTPYGGAPNTGQQGINEVPGIPIAGNGAFSYGDGLKVGKFKDGLAKTAIFSERMKGSGRGSEQLASDGRGHPQSPRRRDLELQSGHQRVLSAMPKRSSGHR